MNYAVHVETAEKPRTLIRIKYPLCSEDWMLRLDNATGKRLERELCDQGFERIECSDGSGGGAWVECKSGAH
jgi:hypothetical protein